MSNKINPLVLINKSPRLGFSGCLDSLYIDQPKYKTIITSKYDDAPKRLKRKSANSAPNFPIAFCTCDSLPTYETPGSSISYVDKAKNRIKPIAPVTQRVDSLKFCFTFEDRLILFILDIIYNKNS